MRIIYKKLWQAVIFVAVLCVVTFGELPGNDLLMGELQNTAHTIVFGLLALYVLTMIRSGWGMYSTSNLLHYLVAGVVSLLAGIGVELVQAMIQRDADIRDVLRDGAGIIAFLGFYALRDRHLTEIHKRRPRTRVAIIALCLPVLLAAAVPVITISCAYIEREYKFPLVLDFNNGWYRAFVTKDHAVIKVVKAPHGWSSVAGMPVARVTLKPAAYPGIKIADVHPDWAGYSFLMVNIYSDSSVPLALAVRIHDRLHNNAFNDRFNRRFVIHSGVNRVKIPLTDVEKAPLGRVMDMHHIAAIVLFSPGLQRNRTLFIKDIRLE